SAPMTTKSKQQKATTNTASSQSQLGLFAAAPQPAPNPVVERLAAVDINALTPLQALALIAELAAAARGDGPAEVGPGTRPK
ncbi:MAG: hypothetical protein ACKOH8_02510, partial [Gemmatimonadota bacterium]